MIIEKIGRGRYSDVHKVLEIKSGKAFALKIIDVEGLTEAEF